MNKPRYYNRIGPAEFEFDGFDSENAYIRYNCILHLRGIYSPVELYIYHGDGISIMLRPLAGNIDFEITSLLRHLYALHGEGSVLISIGGDFPFTHSFNLTEQIKENARSLIDSRLPAPCKVYVNSAYNPVIITNDLDLDAEYYEEGLLRVDRQGTIRMLREDNTEYTIVAEQIPCGFVSCFVSYADNLDLSKTHSEWWIVENITNSVGESVELADLNNLFKCEKTQRIEISMYIDGLDAYSVAYYSEIINANKVLMKINISGSGTFTHLDGVRITTKSITIPTGGNNNRVEVKAIVEQLN
jgi:hypothetical protein